jgi:predicted outer membrane repeat protein
MSRSHKLMMKLILLSVASACLLAAALFAVSGSAAHASVNLQKLSVKPIIDARLRYETVDQPTVDAEALTLRVRAGAETSLGALKLLIEGEATAAPIQNYNAFPFPLPGERQWKPGEALIADPQNLELNRAQLRYGWQSGALTLGRQRINHDDQRWVGSVGWRQNEQTFDALRGETRIGPASLDLAYAAKQRTIFGEAAGAREAYEGDFVLTRLSMRQEPVEARLFAYLLNYDETFFLGNSSQTYGGAVSATIPLGENQLSFRGSYARQSDYGRNPFKYAADYRALEVGTRLASLTLTAGWEELGSNKERAVQTPMATLHKFNGWADMFLLTPPQGLEDFYISAGREFKNIRQLPGLNANLAYHRFKSAISDVLYGNEWNASLGFRAGSTTILLKFADYNARGFGSDTQKLWLQMEWKLD